MWIVKFKGNRGIVRPFFRIALRTEALYSQESTHLLHHWSVNDTMDHNFCCFVDLRKINVSGVTFPENRKHGKILCVKCRIKSQQIRSKRLIFADGDFDTRT